MISNNEEVYVFSTNEMKLYRLRKISEAQEAIMALSNSLIIAESNDCRINLHRAIQSWTVALGVWGKPGGGFLRGEKFTGEDDSVTIQMWENGEIPLSVMKGRCINDYAKTLNRMIEFNNDPAWWERYKANVCLERRNAVEHRAAELRIR